ncbi:MAG: dihydropteroate synthase [Anaerolineae bacterium]|nr:dihydropteroate synthase [Anaerolineae bacterium]
MQTNLKSATQEVIIGPDLPTVIIGERINPTGRKVFSAELQAGDLSRVASDALAQVEAGAAVLDVNVGAAGVDEVKLLPEAVRIVQDTVEVPISIDSSNPQALAAALKVCQGRPLINSVTGERERLAKVLPIVAEYGAAVIGLCMDDTGIPETAEQRLAVAEKILEAAHALGIATEDILFDPLAMTVGANHMAVQTTIMTARLIREKLGANLTAGASNASHGMPDRELLNTVFLAGFIQAGVNAPICNPLKNVLAVRAIDLMLARDEWGTNYIQTYRKLQKMQAQAT